MPVETRMGNVLLQKEVASGLKKLPEESAATE